MSFKIYDQQNITTFTIWSVFSPPLRDQIVNEEYIGTSLDEVETQVKKLADFQQSLKAQQSKINLLRDTAKRWEDEKI